RRVSGAPLGGVAGGRRLAERARRGEPAAARARAGARLPQPARAEPLLQRLLQWRALAVLSLLHRPRSLRDAHLLGLRGDQRALRRGPRPRGRAGRTRLGARLPADAGAAAPSSPAARPRDQLLSPHPLPFVGDLSLVARARGDPPRLA